MMYLALPILFIACAQEPICVQVQPPHDGGNHLQPFDVAVDSQRRRVYSTALAGRQVAVYDADTHEILAIAHLPGANLTTPDIVVDGDGIVWVLSTSNPRILRINMETEDQGMIGDVLDEARIALPRATGGIIAVGRHGGQESLVAVLDSAGMAEVTFPLTPSVRAMLWLDDGTRFGLLNDETLRRFDETGAEVASPCVLPFAGAEGSAQLDDGTIVLASDDHIGLAGCDGEEPQSWQVGVENRDVISLGSAALVLDRIGSGDGVDPNLGLGRLVDGAGISAASTFVTGKNTGFGDVDPATGLVWANSEGTSEIWLLDPWSGTTQDRIRTGTHLDNMAVDPEAETVIYATGRLSDTIVRLEDHQVTAEGSGVRWPWSPVPDLARQRLWVLSQTDNTITGLDPVSLDSLVTHDPGLGPNALLTFSALMLHPVRATLFLAESQQDLLLELDPDSGAILHQWDLGGPVIHDPDEIGEISVRVASGSQYVYVVRSNDCRIQRLHPDDDEILTVQLDQQARDDLARRHKTDLVRLYIDEGLLYIGGYAVDLDTLERRGDADLPVSRLAGRNPAHRGHWLGVDDDRHCLVHLDEDGMERGTLAFAAKDLNASVFHTDNDDDMVVMTRPADGSICWFAARLVQD